MAERDVAQHYQKLHQAYIDVFQSESGKLVLADLETKCKIFLVQEEINRDQAIFDLGSQIWYKIIRNYLLNSPEETYRRYKELEKGIEDGR